MPILHQWLLLGPHMHAANMIYFANIKIAIDILTMSCTCDMLTGKMAQ